MNVEAFIDCAKKRICPVCRGSNVCKWETPDREGSKYIVHLLVCNDCGGVPLLCTLTGCIRFCPNMFYINMEFCPFCHERSLMPTHAALMWR